MPSDQNDMLSPPPQPQGVKPVEPNSQLSLKKISGASLIQAGNLRLYLKAHSGEKPKNTDVTPFKADDLDNHLKIPPQHIQEKNLKGTF